MQGYGSLRGEQRYTQVSTKGKSAGLGIVPWQARYQWKTQWVVPQIGKAACTARSLFPTLEGFSTNQKIKSGRI